MKRLTLLLLGICAGWGGDTARAELPPDEQAAVDRTLAALNQGDFATAGTCFQTFRNADDKAAMRKSLGEAEAKIPGRELRAIDWLGAYLADEPRAPDRDASCAEIGVLNATSRARIEQLVQSNEDAVLKLPPVGRDENLREIVRLWAELREDDHALRTIDLIQGDGSKSDALSSLIEVQTTRIEIQYGSIPIAEMRARLESAQKLAGRIPIANSRSYPLYHVAFGYLAIARRQTRDGDFVGVRESVAVAQKMAATLDGEWRAEAMGGSATAEIGLARAQVKRGDAANARKTLVQAAEAAEAVNRPNEKFDLLRDLADAQIRAGDLPGARQSLAKALPLAAIYNDKDRARLTIARDQVAANDISGARQTIALAEGQPPGKVDVAAAVAKAWPVGAPFPSETNTAAFVTSADQWEFLMPTLNKPWFTAYPDFSNYMAMASQIERSPVDNGMQPSYRPHDRMYGLGMVCERMVEAQSDVDGLLRMQFGK